MANLTGVKKGNDLGILIKTVKANGYNLTAMVRELGCDRANVRCWLTKAILAGDERIDPTKMLGVKVQIFWPLKDLLKARDELGIRNERKISKENWKNQR